MKPIPMTERVTFFVERVSQNSFGESVRHYEETGKGWLSIKFKSAQAHSASPRSASVTYQAIGNKPLPPFQRLKWRAETYEVLPPGKMEGESSTLFFFIQKVS